MKRGTKLCIIILAVVLLIGTTVIRNRQITQMLDTGYGFEVRYHEMGEIVPYGDNYADYTGEILDGYSVRADKAEVLTYEKFIERFGQTSESAAALLGDTSGLPEKILLVTTTFFNEDSDAEGPYLENITCDGTQFRLNLDAPLTILANDFLLNAYNENLSSHYGDALGIFLRQGSSNTINIVYDYNRSEFTSRGWERLDEEPMYLSITWHPVSERITLSVA